MINNELLDKENLNLVFYGVDLTEYNDFQKRKNEIDKVTLSLWYKNKLK